MNTRAFLIIRSNNALGKKGSSVVDYPLFSFWFLSAAILITRFIQILTGVCPGRSGSEVRRLILWSDSQSPRTWWYRLYHIYSFLSRPAFSPTCIQLIIQWTLIVIIWLRKAHTQGEFLVFSSYWCTWKITPVGALSTSTRDFSEENVLTDLRSIP